MKKIWMCLICLSIVCGLVACGNNGRESANSFGVKIVNSSSEDIYGIGYSNYVDGELLSSGGGCNADNSAIKKGDEFALENIPDADEFDLELSVVDKDGKEYPCGARIHIDVESGEAYTFQILGNFEDGFEIKSNVSINTGYFGFQKSDFSIVEEKDIHGGFHGDGSYYLIMDCSENKEKALEILSGWKELPLSENLSLIMYGGEKDGMAYGYNLAEEAKIPRVENGYYYFCDRHSESTNSADDSELFNRSSFNFSIAIYDSDTDKMYYFEFDT